MTVWLRPCMKPTHYAAEGEHCQDSQRTECAKTRLCETVRHETYCAGRYDAARARRQFKACKPYSLEPKG